ncbi:DinB family protein [Deinococcus sp.]|uniref:DinB family protein n=1 Tax=Deinococcus sp. TaxID=47478 RepID=UPI003C799B2D
MTETTTVLSFLAEQYGSELKAFQDSLDSVPDEAFAVATLSHAPAWHALHICDWLRLVVMNDRTPNHHHLGWEDKSWAQNLKTFPAPLSDEAGKAAVLARLDEVSAQVLACLRGMTDDDLKGMTFSPSAPTGERPRLLALGLHLRHVAYHRGQVQLGKKVSG